MVPIIMRALLKALTVAIIIISSNKVVADNGDALLLYDLVGTKYYCSVDVGDSLEKAVNHLKQLGIPYLHQDYYKVYEGKVKLKKGRFIQIVGTGQKEKGCSLALVRSNVRLEPFDDALLNRFTTHSVPSIVFIEPHHTAAQNDLVEQLSLHLAIDYLYQQDPWWRLNSSSEWVKEFEADPKVLFQRIKNGKLIK